MPVKQSAMICIDASNYHYGERLHRWKIDYERLKQYFDSLFDIKHSIYYEGNLPERVYFEYRPSANWEDYIRARKRKREYFKKLKSYGWRVRTKPVSSIIDSTTGKPRRKCNFDVELTIDTIDLISDYEVLILGSGDGDFVKLVKYLKGKSKTVIVLSWKDRLNKELAKTGNNLIKIGSIKEFVQKQPEKGQINLL